MKQKKPKPKDPLLVQSEQDLQVEWDLAMHELGELTIQLDAVFNAINKKKEQIASLIQEKAELKASE